MDVKARGERVGARRGRRAGDGARDRINREARGHRPTSDRPGAGQRRSQRSGVGAAGRAAGRRASVRSSCSSADVPPGPARGQPLPRRLVIRASGVLTACATATGVTLSAARNVTASVLIGSNTRSVMRAVSPGAIAIVRFSRSGFSRSGFASLGPRDEPRIRDVGEEHGLRLLQQRASQSGWRLIHLVRDELTLEAGRQLPVERRASRCTSWPCCPCS